MNMSAKAKRMKLEPRTQVATESPTEGANTAYVPVVNATTIANKETRMR